MYEYYHLNGAYYVLGTILRTFHLLIILILTTPYDIGTITNYPHVTG